MLPQNARIIFLDVNLELIPTRFAIKIQVCNGIPDPFFASLLVNHNLGDPTLSGVTYGKV